MTTRAWGPAGAWVYRFLVTRDGERCKDCGEQPPAELFIDHVDNDPSNNDPTNLRLLCRRCNRLNTIVTSMSVSVKAGENAAMADNATVLVDATQQARRKVDYSSGGAEMQASNMYEVPFRKWVRQTLRESGQPVSMVFLINGGAEKVGCSVMTTRRYMQKMLSPMGELYHLPATGQVWWREPPQDD